MMNGAASSRKPDDAELQPEADDLLDLLADPRVGHVEVGLEVVEAVVVPRARLLVERPRRVLVAGEHHPLAAVGRLGLGPHVPVAVRRCRIGAGGLEPRVLVGRVVDDEVDHHPDAAVAGLVDELDEVAERAEPGVDGVEVGDVVAVVAVGAGVDRVEPDARDAEPGEVVEPVDESGEIADPVAVGVLERVDVEAVDDTVAIPAFGHPPAVPPPSDRTRRRSARRVTA